MATNPTIQFKRKTSATGAPASLQAGEPAFNTVENFLYVGNGSAVKWVGAEILDHTTTAFTSTTSLATRKAIGDIFAPLRSPVFTGTITSSNLVLSGDLAVNGGDITTTSGTFNLIGAGSKTDGITLNIGPTTALGSTSTINIGKSSDDGSVNDIYIGQGYDGTRNGTVTISSKSVVIGAGSSLVLETSTVGTAVATFNLLNTSVTNANVLGAAGTVTIGASGSGTINIRNSTIRLGGSTGGATLATSTVSGLNHLSIIPSGNLVLSATRSDVMGLGTQGTITVVNGSSGTPTSISGAPLLLGDYTDSGGSAQPGEIRILESGGSNYAGFKAQAMSSNSVYTLPSAFPGSSGYVLQSDTSGNMSWAAPSSSASVGITATGASTSYNLIFTDASATNTSASLFIDNGTNINYNPSTDTLTVGAVNANSTLTVTGVTTLQGASTLQGAVNANSTLTVTGVTTLQGASTLQGAVNANSTLTVTGVTTLQGASTLQGAVNMNSTLTVTGVSVHQGAGAFNSTLSVTGAATFIDDIAVNGGDITSTATTFNLLNTTVTNANVLGDLRTLSIGNNTTTGQVVNMFTGSAGTSTYNFATGDIANGATKTINIGSNNGVGTTNVNIGAAGSGSAGKTIITSGVVDINSSTISSNATVLSLFATNLTVQGFHNAGTLSLGAATGNATIRNASTNINGTLTVTGVTTLQGASTLQGAVNANSTLTVTGVTTLQGASTLQGAVNMNSTLTVTGATVIQGALSTNSNLSVTGTSALIGNVTASGDIAVNGGDITSTATTFNLLNSTVTGLNIGGGANTVNIGSTTATINLGTGTTGATVNIKGNLVVDGSTTTVNSTTVTIDDLNIVLADGQTTAAGVDGAGISLGTSGITWNYVHGGGTFANWTSTENLDLTTGKSYKIGNQSVLSSSTLGPSVVTSSLTQVGTIATGTWRGSVIAANWGGTGFGTYTVGQLLYADTTTSLAKLTAAATPGSLVASNGAGVAPEYKVISLTNGTVTSSSGTLTLAIQNAAADGSTKGLASFNSTQFDDSSGLITLDTIDGGTYA